MPIKYDNLVNFTPTGIIRVWCIVVIVIFPERLLKNSLFNY